MGAMVIGNFAALLSNMEYLIESNVIEMLLHLIRK